MGSVTAIPGHLPEKLAISFWLWNYFYGVNEAEAFCDLERCLRELGERGFNTVRVESGVGLCHDAQGRPRGEIALHAPFGEYSRLRQMNPALRPTRQQGCRCDVLKKVVALFTLAQKYDIYIILSSWFYLHTFWWLEDELVEEFFAVAPHERFLRFAREYDHLLVSLGEKGLHDRIAFVEIQNEFDGVLQLWRVYPEGDDPAAQAEREKVMRAYRERHEEALAFLRDKYPHLLFAIDTCSPKVPTAIMPRNAQLWNHHMYYSWGVYGSVFEPGYYHNAVDDARAKDDPRCGRFLRHPLIPMESIRAAVRYPEYFEKSWIPRAWFFNNLDPATFPELEQRLTSYLEEHRREYEQGIDENLDHAQRVRREVAPQMMLVMGEGATYCASLEMRWEERSDAYWSLVDYATRRMKERGYWGCVPRTNSGPEDPSWVEFPERLRHANHVILA